MAKAGSANDHHLIATDRPDFELGARELRLVDLFCGCGGLTLGVAQAANEFGVALCVALAVDNDSDALALYQANFPKATTSSEPVERLFGGELGKRVTAEEKLMCSIAGSVDALVAGPPCQGHSDLNNHTRREDPKNLLYLRTARAVEVLGPRFVLIENVPTVVHDSIGVVAQTREKLIELGYSVSDHVVALDRLGVAQRRRRHVLLALRPNIADAHDILSGVAESKLPRRDLRWAIGDLKSLEDRQGYDTVSRVSRENRRRMEYLLKRDLYDLPNDRRPKCHRGDHSYRSMYGRLKWNEPAQTITSGFTSIGQGRYMHPDEPRALTPHEAARIQGFPDYFWFTDVAKRTSLATVIGNAVPPDLSATLLREVLSRGGSLKALLGHS